MNPLQDRIDQWRKMAQDDPDNELGHYRLGQFLMEAKQYSEAVASFRHALEVNPHFSKVYQLLATCHLELQERPEAIQVLHQGFAVAQERGDNIPREEMGKMLVQLGEKLPEVKEEKGAVGPATGFRCQRPGCFAGRQARQLPAPPRGLDKELGERIYANVCSECWNDWLKNMSIKVINELRLDLSTERGAEEYDRHLREFLGLE